ncbi:hypothetical protein Cgig2_000321 [Carnegiea gigantea]|uniref:Uncharacterized protein n=1 Tax=Carnegiea gigantea TaxID=171969 RepID=A0A9Q1GMT9_9CARY|nr:hypothetical protein Cgig2_000321 [Carnegiea gigantea]
MLPFSVLGAWRSLAGGSCREAVLFLSPSSLTPYCLPGQTAASSFRLRLWSSSSASWSFSGNQGLSFKMKIESDRSGVGPVRSRTDSRPVRSSVQGLANFRSSVQPVRSSPGPMSTPSGYHWWLMMLRHVNCLSHCLNVPKEAIEKGWFFIVLLW